MGTDCLGENALSMEKTFAKTSHGELVEDNASSLRSLGNRLFYFPANILTKNPGDYGYQYEEVEFQAEDETKLHGWFIHPSVKMPKGTVVFSHGNTGSIGTHFGFCSWLVKAGYQVFIYDYRGFGKSAGTPERAGMVRDAAAAFSYVQTRADIVADQIISFAHSLGGAKSITALAHAKPEGLRAVIAHGTFASYKTVAIHHAGLLGKTIVTDHLAPKDHIAKLAGTPILLIHGTEDSTVPISEGKALYEAAQEPKTFWEVEHGTHNKILYQNQQEYRHKILAWLDDLVKQP